MKKLKIILLALLVMAVPIVAFAGTSHAGSFQSGDNVETKKNEVINHTLFIAGNNVEVNGTVKGDVFCAGRNITINATVDGDVICAGMNVEINGTVMGDVRAAGQVVTLTAKVGHNASLAGNTIRVDADATVAGDLQAAGDTTTINGSVARDLDAAGSIVTVNSMIGRDVQASTDNLQLNSGAKVGGNVTYYSHNGLDQASGATVKGKTVRQEPKTDRHERNTNPLPSILFSLFALLTLAFVLLAVFPRKFNELTDLALTKPGMTVLIGLAACIGVPAVILVSFMTVIGIYLGVILLLAWLLVMLMSGVLTSYYMGRLVLMRTSHHPFVAMLVGVVVFSALLLIPIVNVITIIAAGLFGSGMVIRELFGKNSAPKYEKISHPRRKGAAKA
jgi:cytoskeletal protein CcmA (bactofilin family)